MNDFLKTIAPTVASALLGPLGGAAVTALGSIFGVSDATQDKIADVLKSGGMTPEQLSQIRELEMKYQNEEKERGFKYAELEFKDRDSARVNNVAGGVQTELFYLSLFLLAISLGCEIAVLFLGYPKDIPEIVVGRVLGLLDAVALTVMAYWFGSSSGSAAKNSMLTAK